MKGKVRIVRKVTIKKSSRFYKVNKYRIVSALGSKLYLCKKNKARYTIKILSRAKDRSEIKIMKLLSVSNNVEKNVINVIELLDDVKLKHVYVVTDLLENINVLDYNIGNKKYFMGLLNAIKFLHKNEIVHRNIKPENLFLDKKRKNIVLTGFGQARFLKKRNVINDVAGTPLFLSPEIIKYKNKTLYPKKADIWSAGITMYEIMFDTLPFVGKDLNQLYFNILNKEVFVPLQKLDKEIIDLLKLMLKKNPTQRKLPSISVDDNIKNNFIIPIDKNNNCNYCDLNIRLVFK